MDTSILDSIKEDVGIAADDDSFDSSLISDINTELMFSSVQRGIGEPIIISDSSTLWGDYIKDARLIGAKKYISDKVHLLFDPPTNPTLFQALKDSVDQSEFHLMMIADTISKEGVKSE